MQVLRARSSVLAVRVVRAVVAVVVLAVTVLVLVLVALVHAVLVVLAVLVALMLAMAMLVVAVFMHAMTVLVVAVRMIVLVSQVRLLMPERRHKRLTKSMAQQVAADKHAPGLFLRLIARNGPRTLHQVKLDPLIAAWQRSLCASKLSKNAS